MSEYREAYQASKKAFKEKAGAAANPFIINDDETDDLEMIAAWNKGFEDGYYESPEWEAECRRSRSRYSEEDHNYMMETRE